MKSKCLWLCLLAMLLVSAACGESDERKAQRAADMVAAAEKHYGFGEFDKVAELCDQAIELDGSNSKAYALRSRLRARQGKFSEAEADIRKWSELAPQDPQSLVALARLQSSLGDDKAALESARAGLKLADGDTTTKGWVLWFRILNDDEKGVLQEGADLLRADKYCVPAHLAVSESLARRGDLRNAIQEATAAGANDPAGEEAFLALGRALVESGDYAAARKEINTAIRNNEHGHRGRLLMASCEARAGKLEAAQSALESASGAPETLKVPLAAASAEVAFAAGKNDDALKHIDAVLAAQPRHERMIELRAAIRMRTGDIAKGISELDASIKAAPCAEAHVQRCLLRLVRGDLNGAYEDARAALKLEPKRQSVKLAQGHASRATNRGAEAMNAYSVAFSLPPRSWLARAGHMATRASAVKDPAEAELERKRVAEDMEGAISDALGELEQSQNRARDHYGIACLFALAIDMQILDPQAKWNRAARIEQALAHLKKAREAGYDNRAWWDYDPNLAALRDEPQFKQLWQ
ncbi:MAG: tetratricopeptide repeat protein [Planctomycetes bacterium]|nr:tetratricopeptide repeat protein [Planctomycetota bacterium]MCW8135697.1 tetratricopeptide repeat protein [Planctomycetota bacterium]